LKKLILLGSDDKEYEVPIGTLDGEDCYLLPEDWPEEMELAFYEYMYPDGYMTLIRR